MSGKKSREFRKKMKEENGFDIKKKADMRIAKTMKVMAYLKGKNNHGIVENKAVPATRNIIVNATKIAYRRLKKDMKSNLRRFTNGN